MTAAKNIGVALITLSLILAGLLAMLKTNADAQGAYLCEVFSDNNLDMQQCPAHKNSSSWLLTIAFAVAFMILASGIFLLISGGRQTQENKKQPSISEINVEKLDNEEKTIFDSLKTTEGSAYQSDLIKATGYSKVKVTRVLDKMESKGLVERKRRGMANIIVLK